MRPHRVVIVGNGIAPAAAAIALVRAFRAGLEVEWVETPGEISAHRAVSSLPNLQAFHRLLGLNEADLLRAARGTFTLGQQYLGFSGGEGGFLHSYGPIGHPVAGLPFAQFWIKARQAGLPAAFDDFARESVAARNGRIRIADTPNAPATAYGYHFDARGYAGVLRAHAARSGVTITPDAAPAAVVEAGRVTSLRLSDGRMVPGELFIDATPGAAILSALDDDGLADDAISGIDRLMLASARALRPLPLYSRVSAHRAGWSALYPLQDRTAIVVAYDSKLLGDDEAAKLTGMPLAGEPEFLPFTARHRTQPWVGNAIAIGEAVGQVEPLATTGLHQLQVALTHLVSLFPVRADAMPEAGIYNDELAQWHARLQDFQAAHYALNRRTGEPFWDTARAHPRSAELDSKIALFSARGMIAQYNQESFAEDEWQAAFIGHGLVPRSYDPQVDRVDEQQVMSDFRNQLGSIRADVTAMETHEAALARALAR